MTLKKLKTLDKSRVFSFGSLLGEHHNEPMSYVRLLLSGKMEEYLRNNTDYTPLSDMR